jgi:hypothetical protein
MQRLGATITLGIALTAGPMIATSAQAMPVIDLGVVASQALPFEQTQLQVQPDAPGNLYHGRRYCFYLNGWHGSGWYRCGYAWHRGFGWGGPRGWRGWHPAPGHPRVGTPATPSPPPSPNVHPNLHHGLGAPPNPPRGLGTTPNPPHGLGATPSLSPGLGTPPRRPPGLGTIPGTTPGLGVHPNPPAGLGATPRPPSAAPGPPAATPSPPPGLHEAPR